MECRSPTRLNVLAPVLAIDGQVGGAQPCQLMSRPAITAWAIVDTGVQGRELAGHPEKTYNLMSVAYSLAIR